MRKLQQVCLMTMVIVALAPTSFAQSRLASQRVEKIVAWQRLERITDDDTGDVQVTVVTETPIVSTFISTDSSRKSLDGPAQRDGLDSIDFTEVTTFEFAKSQPHAQLVTIDAEYRDRYAVEPVSGPPYTFLGNAILVRQGERTLKLWIDFAPDLSASMWLIAQLPSSQSIRVTYDPNSGLATSVVVLPWR
jgi:hypothetical protein